MEGNLKFLLQQPQRHLNKNIKLVNHKHHSNISSDKLNKFETFSRNNNKRRKENHVFNQFVLSALSLL